jgi:outer membrane protein
MKKILVVMIITAFAAGILAESAKFAYVDTDRIMMTSDLTQEAQTILLNEKQNWEQEIADLDTDLEGLYNDYESKKMIMLESSKQEAEEKIMELRDQRMAKVDEIFGENGKFYQKQAELMEPILDKLKIVIEKVAVENNYSMIFDAATGGLLYAKPSMDITDLIMEELEKSTGEEDQE